MENSESDLSPISTGAINLINKIAEARRGLIVLRHRLDNGGQMTSSVDAAIAECDRIFKDTIELVRSATRVA